jgi:hypothetical protein
MTKPSPPAGALSLVCLVLTVGMQNCILTNHECLSSREWQWDCMQDCSGDVVF